MVLIQVLLNIVQSFLNGQWTTYEGPAEDKKKHTNVEITEDMTPKDVMSKVLEILDKVPVEPK